MKSTTVPSFWAHYNRLEPEIRKSAKKAYRLWSENPFHPSLHFKCIDRSENIWSVRVSRGYRSLGVFDADTVTWFWVGRHDEYNRFFG
jgi:hypothetical protein